MENTFNFWTAAACMVQAAILSIPFGIILFADEIIPILKKFHNYIWR